MTDSEHKVECCSVKTMCGRSLAVGVVRVSVCTMAVSTVALVLSVLNVKLITCAESHLNARPRLALDLLFSMVVIFISIYQLVVTALMLWQAVYTKGNMFLCSLWYVSHLSILPIYGIMFCARIAVCFAERLYFVVAVTAIFCTVYEGVFIYFTIVVNSYLQSLGQERYY